MEALKNEYRWKMVKRKKQVLNLCAALGFIFSFSSVDNALADAISANATPDYHSTLEGSSSHSQLGDDYNISMGTDHVKDYYNSFNIGRDISVNISGGSRYVAKISESGGLSHIYGQLNASGVSVFLQNSSGITFHGSSQINVGSLLATTAGEISFNDDGFELSDFGDASVINNGDIVVSDGGFAILAAPYVENNGYIQANLGHIALASTTAMTVDLRGDGLITYGVTDESLSKAGVKNTGTLKAQSGKVTISAAVASDIIDSVVNLEGVIDADSFGEGYDGGSVLISSTGDINMSDVEITVDGGKNGNGGDVYTWADGTNKFGFESSISANGGDLAGDGGTIEVSGNHISFGGQIDATASNGNGGALIIDPATLRIRNGSGATLTTPLIDIIYEKTVETWSKLGIDVVLDADYQVVLENLFDNVLEGGAGSITLKTIKNSGAVLFADKNDKISTTSGDINIEAGTGGINIGHLETGKGFIGEAGNINLTTNVKGFSLGGDITTRSITVGGATTTFNQDAESEVNISSYGDTIINGKVQISNLTLANNADASVGLNIQSKFGDVTINGPVSLTSAALANNSSASADINIVANNGEVDVNNLSVDTEIVSLELTSGNGDLDFNNINIDATHISKTKKEVSFSSTNGSIKGGNINSDVGVTISTVDNSFLGLKGNVNVRDIKTANFNKDININADGNVIARNLEGNVNINADNGTILAASISTGTGADVELKATKGGLFNLGGNIIVGSIDTVSKAGDIEINADNNVLAGDISGSLGGNVSISASNNITTKDISGSAYDIVLDAGGDVVTESLKSANDIYIESDKSVTVGNIFSGDDVDIIAKNDVTTGVIDSMDDVEISSGANVTTKHITSGDDIYIDALGDIKTDHILASNLDSKGSDVSSHVEINSSGSIEIDGSVVSSATSTGFNSALASIDINSEGETIIDGVVSAVSNSSLGDSNSIISINSNNGEVEVDGNLLAISNSKLGNANSVVSLTSYEDTTVNGKIMSGANSIVGKSTSIIDVVSNNGGVNLYDALLAASKGNINNSNSEINISAENDVLIEGDITATSDTVNGKASSQISIISNNAGIEILTDITASADSINGNVISNIEVSSNNADINIEGDITATSNSTNGDVESEIDISSSAANIDVQGAIVASANSTNGSAVADISLFADGDIMLSALVPDPLAEANGASVQQRTSGTDSTADGDASLTLDAGGDVRFFDANNFDQNGIHKETGTPFDPAGYDVNGFDINGFDINGFNQFGFDINGIHKDTGTPFGPDGYDQNGFDIAGFDRNGFDVNGFDVNGFDINGYDQFGNDANGFNIVGIHRDTGTIYDPFGFDVNGDPAPNSIDLLVSKLDGSNDNEENNSQSDGGLANLEPAGGGDNDCDFMNCDEGNS